MSAVINFLGLIMLTDIAYRYYIFNFIWWWLTTVPLIVTLFVLNMMVVLVFP